MGLGDYPNTIQGSLPNSRSRELQPQPQTLHTVYRACALLQGCHLDFSYPNPKPTSYVASNMCASSTMSVYHRPQHRTLHRIKHVCEFNDVITPPPQPHILHSIKHVCELVARCHYTPPQPHILHRINHVCELVARCHCTPPQPHILHRINHVCELVARCHCTPLPPNLTSYTASTMCASSTMSLHPTPTSTSHLT